MVDKPEIIEAQRFEDFRGWLSVSAEGFHVVQINQGFSKKAGTLRGLHFQEGKHAQAKLVSCLQGSIFNVAVDLRPGDTFGYAYGEILSFENQKQMLIPRGFAHGYLTREENTLMQWCVDNDFCGEAAKAVQFDDPDATKGISLLDKLEELYKIYGYCLNTLHSYEFDGSAGFAKMQRIMQAFRGGIKEFGGKKVVKLLDYAPGLDGLPKSDVLKFLLEDNCSIVVHPSGTEPKLKTYISISAENKEAAEKIEAEICKSAEEYLK